MKSITLLPLIFLAFTLRTSASHLLGGELSYRFVSADETSQKYRVTLTLFADCASLETMDFQALYEATPGIKLIKGSTRISDQPLMYNTTESDKEITPVCFDEAGNTTCNSITNPVPGIKKFVYDGDFILADTSSDWQFLFYGIIPNLYLPASSFGISHATRSNLIGNAINVALPGPPYTGVTLMYLQATLNNTQGPNNSATFTATPSPFFCLNKPASYSLGAIDQDGDQLQFGLVPAQISYTDNIQYPPPFSATAPLPTAPGNFNFNPVNGQMNFTPDRIMGCLVDNLVEEYRNGVKVGSTIREMTFIILNSCNNDGPSASISGITNATTSFDPARNPTLSICEGQIAEVAFDLEATDPNGDNTTITYKNLPVNSSINITGNGTTHPRAHFTWNAMEAFPGNYIFYLTYTDNGCPIAVPVVQAYTVNIIPHPVHFTNGSNPGCTGQAAGQVWVMPSEGTTSDYSYHWVDSAGNTLRTTNSTKGDTMNGLMPGRYKVYARNKDGCGTNIHITLTGLPLPKVALRSDTVLCTGMPIILETKLQDSTHYRWSTGDTTNRIRVTQPAFYVLTATNRCGSSEAGVRINYIKCNYCFFIPNAFSPNGDGRNDLFVLKQTCPANKYMLQIFDRWGRRLFTSLSINKSWDGTYNDQPVESGTYFYILEARPEDRSQEIIKLKGDLTLIR